MHKINQNQAGSVLLESLIAVIIFSIGILGLVATLARSTASVNDTRQRDEVFMAAQNALDGVRFSANKAVPDITNDLQAAHQFTFSKKTIADTSNCAQVTNTNHIYNSGGNNKPIATTDITYGSRKTDGTDSPRRVSFCSYRDDGPFRN